MITKFRQLLIHKLLTDQERWLVSDALFCQIKRLDQALELTGDINNHQARERIRDLSRIREDIFIR